MLPETESEGKEEIGSVPVSLFVGRNRGGLPELCGFIGPIACYDNITARQKACILGGPYMGLIAVIIVWSIIEATCAKNATPLLILLGIYAVISIIAEFAY